jgi:hypothetical protein
MPLNVQNGHKMNIESDPLMVKRDIVDEKEQYMLK